MKLIFCLILLMTGCSFKKSHLENQTSKGHQELYSEPNAPKLEALSADERRIVIASTNDIHGKYSPQTISFEDKDNKNKLTITIGGQKVIKSYFEILRQTFKDVVLLDSGDIFSTATELDEVSKFYQNNNYDAITVGLRDFNLKVPLEIGNNAKLFKDFSKSLKIPFLLTNLHDLKTGRAVDWEGTKSHLIKEVNGVKIGIIGLIPDDIVAQTPVNNRVGLFVENMLQSTLRHSRLLRSLGADIIIVMSHQGIDCNSEVASQMKLPLTKVNFEPQRENICDLKNTLGQYLERLPPGLVDLVIGGRNEQKMANFVNGTLVVGGFSDGKSFSYNEFIVNIKNKKIVPNKTVVHQPVFFCNEFFEQTKDCFYQDISVNHKKRIPAKFLGKLIEAENLAEVPSLNESRVSYLTPQAIAKNLSLYDVDLSYLPPTSGQTQLFIISINGGDLLKVLEQEYNDDRKNDWRPSPYILKNSELMISISGLDIDLNKRYRILSDLESIQKHQQLIKHISHYEGEALMNKSWGSLEEDSLSSQLAAQTR